jgi:hypothetical protein
MVEKIGGGNGGPQVPEPKDDAYHVADGFADDAVGAGIKHGEAVRTRGDPNRAALTAHAQMKAARHQIAATSTFARAEAKDQEKKSKIFRESGTARRDGLKAARGRQKVNEVDEIDIRVEELMEDLASIIDEIEEAGLDTLMKEVESDPDLLKARLQKLGENLAGPTGARLAKLQRLLKRLRQAEIEAKTTLQHVLTGGSGIQLLNDPRITFKKLFERIALWPRRIPPGRRPETDEEFNAFIGWVFLPPDAPEELKAVE